MNITISPPTNPPQASVTTISFAIILKAILVTEVVLILSILRFLALLPLVEWHEDPVAKHF
jgi:hypothetical protein